MLVTYQSISQQSGERRVYLETLVDAPPYVKGANVNAGLVSRAITDALLAAPLADNTVTAAVAWRQADAIVARVETVYRGRPYAGVLSYLGELWRPCPPMLVDAVCLEERSGSHVGAIGCLTGIDAGVCPRSFVGNLIRGLGELADYATCIALSAIDAVLGQFMPPRRA